MMKHYLGGNEIEGNLPTAGNGTNLWTSIFIAGLKLFALLIRTPRPN